MSEEISEEMLENIKSTHENIALTIGTILSMILVAYFLSYSELANSTHNTIFWFEMISSFFIVAGLFYIQRIAFSLLKIRYIANDTYKAALTSLTFNDLKER
ncbi:MAG: hypothetical protein Q9M18_07630 [Mariprofundaceae bacterium]|nr:hypothetical protein [Mariprofundaceae bacterium]